MKPYKKFIYVILPWLFLAITLNLIRLSIAEVPSYIYMNWNVFLGLLPVLCAWLFEYKKKFRFLSIIFFLTWLFFLPNAPYMITDFIHLRDVGTEAMLWYDGMMLFAYAVVGVYACVFSMHRVKINLTRSMWFVPGVSLLSGFGIYLGRYIRWNTWDIITRPLELFKNILEILGDLIYDPLISITTVVFMVAMMVMYYSYRNIIKK